MKIYQFREMLKEQYNAGSKAVNDVTRIVRSMGAKSLPLIRLTGKDLPFVGERIEHFIGHVLWIFQTWFYFNFIPRGSTIVVQHPLTTGRAFLHHQEGVSFLKKLKEHRQMHVVTLIHDINELRSGMGSVQQTSVESIGTVLGYSDVVIVHNRKMADWLVQEVHCSKQIVMLGIFDYLTDRPLPWPDSGNHRSVTFAGNLRLDKCGFLTQVGDADDVDWYLYGANLDRERVRGEKVTYGGCLKPDELPSCLINGFGLVWDGPSVDACEGEWGSYLKYNNPHKMSLYLASGLPVITWRKAAQAAFVEQEQVGFCVDSLREIRERLAQLSDEEYLHFRAKAIAFAAKLRSGYFVRTAVANAFDLLAKG